MKTRTVGIAETSPGIYRLTFDGCVLGDSRGYSKPEAVAEAKRFVARNTVDGDWVGAEWVEFRNVLDASLNT